MVILGLRCSNTDFTYAILEGEKKKAKVLFATTLKYPLSGKWPDILSWLYAEIGSILSKHSPEGLMIKRAESGANGGDAATQRIEAEGVSILSARHKAIKYIEDKRKRTIAKELGYKGTNEGFETAFHDNNVDMNTVSKMSEKLKEAILVARSGLR